MTSKEVYNSAGVLTNTITYTYDTSDTGGFTCFKGQLFKVTDGEGWQRTSYDFRGRVLKTRRYLNARTQSYDVESTYDEADRIRDVTYPGSVAKIRYSYDTGGNLSVVESLAGTSTREVFYRLGYLNALKQVVAYTNHGEVASGSITKTLSYYANSQRIQRLRASNPAGGYHQDLTYTFDKESNLKSLTDGVYSSTASDSLSGILYDDLHRLTQLTSAAGTKTFGYNAIGNILTNGENGGAIYTYISGKPHAVAYANGKTFNTDGCGNIVTRGTQTLKYDEENRLREVSDASGAPTVYFGYADGGTRLWRRKGSSDYTVWIGGIYEERSLKTLCHVFADGKRIATFEPSGGSWGSLTPASRQFAEARQWARLAVDWPFQGGRTPSTVMLGTLVLILGVCISARRGLQQSRALAWLCLVERTLVRLARAVQGLSSQPIGEDTRFGAGKSCKDESVADLILTARETRWFHQPIWRRALSVFVMVALVFVTTPTEVEAQQYDPVFYYYHQDHLGSSNILTDRSGNLVQHYGYFAFGKERYKANTSAFKMSNRFTDQVFDEDTGLHYYGARYYDSELGRFMQPDTHVQSVTNPQTLNRYTYANNNPLKYTDPSGNFAWLALLVVVIKAAVIGAALGAAMAAAQGGDIAQGALQGALSGAAGALGPIVGIALRVALAAAQGQDIGKAALLAVASAVIAFGTAAITDAAIPDARVDTIGEAVKYTAVKTVEGAARGATSAAIKGEDVLEGTLDGAKDGALGALQKVGKSYASYYGQRLGVPALLKLGFEDEACKMWGRVGGDYTGFKVGTLSSLEKRSFLSDEYLEKRSQKMGGYSWSKSLEYVGEKIGKGVGEIVLSNGADIWQRLQGGSQRIEAGPGGGGALSMNQGGNPQGSQPQMPTEIFTRQSMKEFDQVGGNALRVK
jgi:RHS repeat-associated protein